MALESLNYTMSAFTEMPFNEVSNEDLKLIFPKEGDTHEGHVYIHDNWYICSKCDQDGNFYTRYADEQGKWHNIDYETEDIGEWYYTGGGCIHEYYDANGEPVHDDNDGKSYEEPIRRSLSWVHTNTKG